MLLKPGKLTGDEFAVMQRHTVIGDALCGDMRSLTAVRPIIRHHHERLDGSGYPDGLAAGEVPITAQIVGIADAYDAMTTTRSYRAARPAADACAELLADAEVGKFDRTLVRSFVRLADFGVLSSLAARANRGRSDVLTFERAPRVGEPSTTTQRRCRGLSTLSVVPY